MLQLLEPKLLGILSMPKFQFILQINNLDKTFE